MKTWKTLFILVMIVSSIAGSVKAAVNGLVFRLQIEIKHRPNLDNFLNFQPMEGNIAQGEKILAGKYDEYLLAMKAKYQYAKNSADPSTIVAYYNNQSVTLDQAFAIQDNQNATDAEVVSRPDTVRTRETIAAVQTHVKFKFEIYTDAEHTLDMVFARHPEWKGSVVQLSEGHYLVGTYKRYEDAIAMQNTLDKEGFRRNIIVAYQNDKKIPVFIAMGLKTTANEPVAQEK